MLNNNEFNQHMQQRRDNFNNTRMGGGGGPGGLLGMERAPGDFRGSSMNLSTGSGDNNINRTSQTAAGSAGLIPAGGMGQGMTTQSIGIILSFINKGICNPVLFTATGG